MNQEEGARILLRGVKEAEERLEAQAHPAALLRHVTCVDGKTGERFEFQLEDEDAPWYWQRELLDWWIDNEKTIVLKARQLGITWLASGLALHYLLFRPGSEVLAVSIKEDEAAKLVNRVWDMLESLPLHLRRHVEVDKPAYGARPTTSIVLVHRDGRRTELTGLSSSPRAGHGRTSALVIYDEFSRQEYAREAYTAGLPTTAGGGKYLIISTANGVSITTPGGEPRGNFYHHLWENSEAYDIKKRFLAWDLHPERDEHWYRRYAMALPPAERGEQYPRDEFEAFLLTGDLYFDREAMQAYIDQARAPIFRCRFIPTAPDKARLEKRPEGPVRVFELPNPEHQYAIAADAATGRGMDYSAATVIDLTTMGFVAKFHAKIDADQFATQLHYLGRWYNTALIAIEDAGGFGEPIVIFLRDGKEGRPPYPRMYRHRQESRGDMPIHKPFGFPMNLKTRPVVLANLERALRERHLPWLDVESLKEYQTFVYREFGTSPAASEGCNDDRVLADAIAVELYRQRGHHPDRKERRLHRAPVNYPWQRQVA